MNSLVYRVAYVSFDVDDGIQGDIERLVAVCRQKNALMNITGVLTYTPPSIFQVLEGEEATVKNLLQTIATDPRHSDMSIVHEDRSDHRLFESWSMEFCNIESRAPIMHEVVRLSTSLHDVSNAKQQATRVLSFLKSYYSGKTMFTSLLEKS